MVHQRQDTNSPQEHITISQRKTRKEQNQLKLKELLAEHKELQNSFSPEEERYTLDEACFQRGEAHKEYMKDYDNRARREESDAANARVNELRGNQTRRELRLRRLWLDIGNLKREMSAWDRPWWDTSTE